VSQDIIELKGVSFAYHPDVPVLNNVTFSIPEKAAVCIVGPNGGGKSTLINLLLGLIKPNRGEVKVFGKKPEQARTRIGYMPQYSVFDYEFPVNVRDVVLMGRLSRNMFGRYSKTDRKAAEAALVQVGMQDFISRPFFALSGGQRQRVLIARALAGNPDLLLLDEPTANIDPMAQEQFYSTLKILSKELTLLVVSHDLGFVSEWLDSVVCVNRNVHVHPVSEITGEVIKDMYGYDVNMIRHDHCCIHDAEGTYTHSHSHAAEGGHHRD